jgi:hypothetical protein
MEINIQNVEELVFRDDKVWDSLPGLCRHRDQWRISMMSPSLRATGRMALMDFLQNAEEAHELALSEYFGRDITIDRLDRRLVRNVEFPISDETPALPPTGSYAGFGVHRDGEKIRITFWR